MRVRHLLHRPVTFFQRCDARTRGVQNAELCEPEKLYTASEVFEERARDAVLELDPMSRKASAALAFSLRLPIALALILFRMVAWARVLEALLYRVRYSAQIEISRPSRTSDTLLQQQRIKINTRLVDICLGSNSP